MSQPVKRLLRDARAFLALRSGWVTRSSLASQDLLILTFHRVLPEELRRDYAIPQLAVTPDELRWILEQLAPYFHINTLSDALRDALESVRAKPLLAITFDDGQWDNLAYGAPVLSEVGVPATFYVPTDFIGSDRLLWHDEIGNLWLQHPAELKAAASAYGVAEKTLPGILEGIKNLRCAERTTLISEVRALCVKAPSWGRMMTWAEVTDLRRVGHEVGSHAMSHDLLPSMSREEKRREILLSKAEIDRRLEQVTRSFCYPNGSHDEECVEFVRDAGYENAVTTVPGVTRAAGDLYVCPRFDMNPAHFAGFGTAMNSDLLWFRILRGK